MLAETWPIQFQRKYGRYVAAQRGVYKRDIEEEEQPQIEVDQSPRLAVEQNCSASAHHLK